MHDSSARPVTRLLGATMLLVANTFLVMILLEAAWLRETKQFWLNSGGYPVLLRDLVKFAFPPCFAADVVFVGIVGLAVLRHKSAHPRLASLGMFFAVLQAVLLGGVLSVIVANNLDNLIHDRPLHWKADAVGRRNVCLNRLASTQTGSAPWTLASSGTPSASLASP